MLTFTKLNDCFTENEVRKLIEQEKKQRELLEEQKKANP
jgi:hypothetical protein